MNTRTPRDESRPERRGELVAQPPTTMRERRSRRHAPQLVSDPTYGCVDWFGYQAADALEEDEDADTRRTQH